MLHICSGPSKSSIWVSRPANVFTRSWRNRARSKFHRSHLPDCGNKDACQCLNPFLTMSFTGYSHCQLIQLVHTCICIVVWTQGQKWVWNSPPYRPDQHQGTGRTGETCPPALLPAAIVPAVVGWSRSTSRYTHMQYHTHMYTHAPLHMHTSGTHTHTHTHTHMYILKKFNTHSHTHTHTTHTHKPTLYSLEITLLPLPTHHPLTDTHTHAHIP